MASFSMGWGRNTRLMKAKIYPVRKPGHLPRWIINILRGLWRG
jgi:hypothetical protein